MTPPLGSVRPSASGCHTGKLIPAKCGIQHLVQYRPCRSDNLTQLLCELSPSNLSSEKDVISGARNNPPLGLHASMLVIKTRAGCSACVFPKKEKNSVWLLFCAVGLLRQQLWLMMILMMMLCLAVAYQTAARHELDNARLAITHLYRHFFFGGAGVNWVGGVDRSPLSFFPL